MDKLAEQCQFDLCELFTVQETRQTSVKNINFRLFKPELTLKVRAILAFKNCLYTHNSFF